MLSFPLSSGEVEEMFSKLPEYGSEKMKITNVYPNKVKRDSRFSKYDERKLKMLRNLLITLKKRYYSIFSILIVRKLSHGFIYISLLVSIFYLCVCTYIYRYIASHVRFILLMSASTLNSLSYPLV